MHTYQKTYQTFLQNNVSFVINLLSQGGDQLYISVSIRLLNHIHIHIIEMAFIFVIHIICVLCCDTGWRGFTCNQGAFRDTWIRGKTNTLGGIASLECFTCRNPAACEHIMNKFPLVYHPLPQGTPGEAGVPGPPGTPGGRVSVYLDLRLCYYLYLWLSFCISASLVE